MKGNYENYRAGIEITHEWVKKLERITKLTNTYANDDVLVRLGHPLQDKPWAKKGLPYTKVYVRSELDYVYVFLQPHTDFVEVTMVLPNVYVHAEGYVFLTELTFVQRNNSEVIVPQQRGKFPIHEKFSEKMYEEIMQGKRSDISFFSADIPNLVTITVECPIIKNPK